MQDPASYAGGHAGDPSVSNGRGQVGLPAVHLSASASSVIGDGRAENNDSLLQPGGDRDGGDGIEGAMARAPTRFGKLRGWARPIAPQRVRPVSEMARITSAEAAAPSSVRASLPADEVLIAGRDITLNCTAEGDNDDAGM